MELFKACKQNDYKMAKVCLENGENPNCNFYTHYTPLHYAVENNNLELVKLLVEHGADINTKIVKNKHSPFYMPSGKYNRRKYNFINTPLHHACLYRKLEIANFLLQNGANPKINNEKQHTSFYYMPDEFKLKTLP